MTDQRIASVDRRKAVREDRRQAWRVVGAGFVLIAIGMFGLVAGLHLSDSSQSSKVSDLTSTVDANHARIVQLEDDYRHRNIPIPPTTTTTQVAARRGPAPATTTPRASTPSTTAPPSTTTTTAPPHPPHPCRQVVGICVPGG